MKPRYADVCREFRWSTHLDALGWKSDGLVNLGETLVDRHRATGRVALRWFGADGATRESTFADLSGATNRFASLLRSLGVGAGDRVAGFMPRVPETIVAMIGTWKAGAVYVPVFTGFGADAIGFRVAHSGAKVLTTHAEYRSRVPPSLADTVTVIGNVAAAVADQPARFETVGRRRDEPAVLLYTSGSTGPPKGVKIATNFPLAVAPYVRYGLDLRADDVFWPTGDPGWGYGLVCYAAALGLGGAVVFHEAAPSPEFALARLHTLGVTNFATTPTLLRAIMALGEERVRRDRVRIRCASSCGEPLNAEVVNFFRRVWDVTVMDHYGSSEFGLPIGNFNAVDIEVKPGSMGLPFPGCRMSIVDDDGRDVTPDTVGQIAMQPDDIGYYSLGYWNDDERTRELDRGGWMTIGDLGRRDRDGYFWFEGRADDVIKSAGYRIGPFEVESAILLHPDVAEAAVVGAPDALRGQIVKAFVVLKSGRTVHPRLGDEIVDVVRRHVGHHQYPRAIEFVAQLPKTESGKIRRFRLRG